MFYFLYKVNETHGRDIKMFCTLDQDINLGKIQMSHLTSERFSATAHYGFEFYP